MVNGMKKFYGTIQLGILVVVLLALGIDANAQTASPSPTPGTGHSDPQAGIVKPVGSIGSADDPLRVEAQSEEEAAILPYYNNYLKDYHLGPEDVISVEVFGQPSYSKTNIVIPPNARISYPLIPGGVFVGGKTVDQVAEEIKKKLDEYIIGPQITVTLDKVGSAKFSVLGMVASPGVKVMNRRYTIYEAIAEAGGIQKGGDKGRVLLVRLDRERGVTHTVIDLGKVMKGKVEVPYLIPGDQIIIPEKRWSVSKIFDAIGRAAGLAILFGIPF